MQDEESAVTKQDSAESAKEDEDEDDYDSEEEDDIEIDDEEFEEEDRRLITTYMKSATKLSNFDDVNNYLSEVRKPPTSVANTEAQNQVSKKQVLNRVDSDLRSQMSNSIHTQYKTAMGKNDARIEAKQKDKNDRATVDQVLDPRTLLVMHKLALNERLDQLYGCISTGKEANVYLAESNCLNFDMLEMQPEGKEKINYAVKIFKTSILVFKDRERYVSGEFRFRKGHCKGNPRKKVKLWAEKETRNLKRICMSGLIRAPWPQFLKNNVIVMEFIGTGRVAAPRLKDAEFTDEEASRLYEESVMMMRHLYQVCKLVHGDLSEYNLLYHEKQIWMIDVSQSVEHDHPMALDFLRRDCAVMNDFFRRKNVFVLTTTKLFKFVTDISIKADKIATGAAEIKLSGVLGSKEEDEALNDMLREAQNGYSDKQMEDDKVFEQIYIPRSLQELSHIDIVRQQEH